MKKQLLSILALLLMAAGSVVAQTSPSDINLHRNEDGSWSFIMPGRNLVMSTETFSTNDTVNGHYLAGVPEGWLILALGDTVPVSNDSLRRTTPITEGTPVTIVPTGNLRRIKSITLVDEAPVVLTLDLATVTTDTTVGDGDTLTGTLGANVKISIADGATVTLDGVTINGVYNTSYRWAGITCLGDATIILSGTNTVKGFYDEYPGIHVPQNKTLTIEGSGSLTASSNGYGCGIGGGYQITCGNIVIAGGNITATGGNQAGIGGGYHGSCGNISITGGTITATGGNNSAGIGGGYIGGCGNISITGGTVNATGGDFAAGIGGGQSSSCGTVTITNGVTSVTATKGMGADYSIGAGESGSCGTVTVGGATGAITTSPYTYPAQ